MIETNLQELDNQLRDALVALNLGGNNLRQQSTIIPIQVVITVNPSPVLTSVHYHDFHNDCNGYKVKSGDSYFQCELDSIL